MVAAVPAGGSRHQISDLESELAGLRWAMESRARIEQAKGMLMLRYRVDEDRAFQMMVQWSSTHNIKLHRVAAVVVAACSDAGRNDLAETTLQGLLAGALGEGLAAPPSGT